MTAAVSPSSFPQSSTGRFDATSMIGRLRRKLAKASSAAWDLLPNRLMVASASTARLRPGPPLTLPLPPPPAPILR